MVGSLAPEAAISVCAFLGLLVLFCGLGAALALATINRASEPLRAALAYAMILTAAGGNAIAIIYLAWWASQ